MHGLVVEKNTPHKNAVNNKLKEHNPSWHRMYE